MKALLRAGVDFDDNADIAVHLTTADTYRPIPGKYNILYSMYECNDLPASWIPKVNEADLIIVPCRQNAWLFKRYTKKPVEVCWEGVDIDTYSYIQRSFPTNRPFVFLWVGATNPRKGTEHVFGAWEVWNRDYPELRTTTQLIMKTTQESERNCAVRLTAKYKDGEIITDKEIKEKMPAERIVRVAGNAIVDTRRLPDKRNGKINIQRPDSLQEIYYYSHCFLLPTRGEGFGLTLAEAASTGMPCIYTPYGGPRDFMDSDKGYPLKFGFAPVQTIGYRKTEDGKIEKYVSHKTSAASADIHDLVKRMKQVYSDYDRALIRGKKASDHIKKGFTWDISAQSLIKIINKYDKLRKAA
jgi:glycosyltransferase involved in cell wall biosynthesis